MNPESPKANQLIDHENSRKRTRGHDADYTPTPLRGERDRSSPRIQMMAQSFKKARIDIARNSRDQKSYVKRALITQSKHNENPGTSPVPAPSTIKMPKNVTFIVKNSNEVTAS